MYIYILYYVHSTVTDKHSHNKMYSVCYVGTGCLHGFPFWCTLSFSSHFLFMLLLSESFPLVMVQLRLKDSANTNVVYSTTLSCHQVNLTAIPSKTLFTVDSRFMGAGLGCSDFYCTHLQIHQLIISSKLYVNTTFTVCISLTQTDTYNIHFVCRSQKLYTRSGYNTHFKERIKINYRYMCTV